MLRRSLLLLLALPVFTAPAPAPDFQFTSVQGGQESLAKYRGKTVALYFFSPSCSHCQHVCKVLAQLQTDHSADLQVLGATFSEDAQQRMPDFMSYVKPTYPVGISKRDAILKWLDAKEDDGKQMPRLVLLDGKGIVRGSYSWRHSIFENPATEDAQIRTAVEKAINAGKGRK